jgi:peptidoglycan/xylan/chitin deacetylase (PgdA/CDA1 family)
MKLSLTFDNGPDRTVTRYVLDLLRERSLHATFFVLGAKIAQPALRLLAERAVIEGHRVGNHTFSHDRPFGTPEGESGALAEIQRTEALIGDLAGRTKLFRPFGGGGHVDARLFSGAALDHLCRERYDVALWTCVPRDWENIDGWPEVALHDLEETQDNVVVLHDLPTGAMRHLERFLDQLARIGAEVSPLIPDSALFIKEGRLTGHFGNALLTANLRVQEHPVSVSKGPAAT